MRVLFLGDVVGRVGREAVADHLPGVIRDISPDFVVCNGENAAGGFGITGKICRELYDAGVDVLTTGNHIWDQREIITYIDTDPNLLRPLNFPEGTPGRGIGVYETRSGHRVAVANVMCRLFMDPLDDPFAAVERATESLVLGDTVDFIMIDLHGEATSEKMAFGHAFDGRVSLVVGTHTHIPTADTMILEHGTAYQSDAGMCGDYDSVIGMKKDSPVDRFTRKMPTPRLEAAEGEGTLCGVFVETDERSGLALKVEPMRLGGRLSQVMPSF